jgi:hypothetical protein
MMTPWIPLLAIIGGGLALRYVVAPRWQKRRRSASHSSGDGGGAVSGDDFGLQHWFGGHDSSDAAGHAADGSASDGSASDGGGGDGGGSDGGGGD